MTEWLPHYTPGLWCVQKLLKYVHNGQNDLILNHVLEYGHSMWASLVDDECDGVIPIDSMNAMPYVVWSSFVKLNSRQNYSNKMSLPMNDDNVARFFQEDYNDLKPFGKLYFFKFLYGIIPFEERAAAAWELFGLLPQYQKTDFCSINQHALAVGYLLSAETSESKGKVKDFAETLISLGLKEAATLAMLVREGSTECVHAILPSVFKFNHKIRSFFIEILNEREEDDFTSPVEWLEALYLTVDDEGAETEQVYSEWIFGMSEDQIRNTLLTVMLNLNAVKPASVTT